MGRRLRAKDAPGQGLLGYAAKGLHACTCAPKACTCAPWAPCASPHLRSHDDEGEIYLVSAPDIQGIFLYDRTGPFLCLRSSAGRVPPRRSLKRLVQHTRAPSSGMAEQSRQDRRGNREARPPRTALHDHAWTDAFIHRIHPWIGRYMERPTQDGEGKARQASNLQQRHRLHHPASIAQSKLRRAGSDTSTSRHETSSAMLAQRRAHAT